MTFPVAASVCGRRLSHTRYPESVTVSFLASCLRVVLRPSKALDSVAGSAFPLAFLHRPSTEGISLLRQVL